jgi:hypothetical protein
MYPQEENIFSEIQKLIAPSTEEVAISPEAYQNDRHLSPNIDEFDKIANKNLRNFNILPKTITVYAFW